MRNTPTIVNVAFQDGPQFWDMRARSLVEQSTQPITNPLEMGQQTIGQVLERIRRIDGYRPLFAGAFGSGNLGTAAGRRHHGLRADTDGRRRAGRSLSGRRSSSPVANRSAGVRCFRRSAAAIVIGRRSFATGWPTTTVLPRAAKPDLGRAAIAGSGVGGANVRAFKTPSLRNVARTAPYMHDGSLATLAEVIDHYSAGGRFLRGGTARRDPLADPRVRPLALSTPTRRATWWLFWWKD